MHAGLKAFAFAVLFAVSASVSSSVSAAPVIGEKAPIFTGIDSNGALVSLADFKGRAVVLEWTNHRCPYVRKHYASGNMQRLQREITEAGATWVSVISSAKGKQGYVSGAKANELTAMRGSYADIIVLDASGDIGRAYGAKTTPHMVLIDEKGIVRYMGAIDDKPSTRRSSLKGARNYVREAWLALTAGKPIDVAVSKPYGCPIKY